MQGAIKEEGMLVTTCPLFFYTPLVTPQSVDTTHTDKVVGHTSVSSTPLHMCLHKHPMYDNVEQS